MKKLWFAGLTLLGTMSANAQTQEGNWMVGGAVGRLEFTSPFQMDLNPSVAHFVKDNWAIGARANLNLNAGHGTTTLNWSVGPYTRYYFGDREIASPLDNGSFFAHLDMGFGGRNSATTNTNTNQTIKTNTTNGVAYGLGAGYSYFVTNNVSLDAMLRLEGVMGKDQARPAASLNVGFQIYLPSATAKKAVNDR